MPPKIRGGKASVYPRDPSARSRNPSVKAKATKEASPISDDNHELKKSKPKGRRKKVEGDEAGDNVGEKEGSEAGDAPTVEVNWTVDLSWALVSVLEENSMIRQGLFPMPGSNTSVAKGGSKRKIDYQYDLAKELFETHEDYKEIFMQTAVDKKQWALKIKNRLKRMTKDVNAYRDELGTTGAGIQHESDINMTADNAFTNKWAEIKQVCPWYWNLKALISERPSVVPVGLGNNESSYDISLLQPGGFDFDASSDGLDLDDMRASDENKAKEGASGQSGDESEKSTDEDGEPENEECVITVSTTKSSGKRKAAAVKEKPARDSKKTVARSGKSVPATAVANKKPKTGIEKLSAMALKEEETTQRVLELKKAKAHAERDKEVAKIKAKAQVKMQQDKLKADLQAKRLDQEFQLRMAQITQGSGSSMDVTSRHPYPFVLGQVGGGNSNNTFASQSGWSGSTRRSISPSSGFTGDLPHTQATSSPFPEYNFANFGARTSDEIE